MDALGKLLEIGLVGPFFRVDLTAESRRCERLFGLGMRNKGHWSRAAEEFATEFP